MFATPAPSVVVPAPTHPVCGNGKVEEGETCDDGNTVGGDGCANRCRREPARFLSWNYVLLTDGSVVSRKTGRALAGRAALSAPEGAVMKSEEGLRYYYELYAAPPLLPPLPSAASVTSLGAGLNPCLLNELGEVWCLGTSFSESPRRPFESGRQLTESGLSLTWNKLRRAAGPVAGLAGNIDFGCILLDGGATAQCWRKDSLLPKVSLGRGRTAQQVVAGTGHVCVLLQNGEIGCWGDSRFGQTGDVTDVDPAAKPDLVLPERKRNAPPNTFLKFDSPAKQIAASHTESCALLENGKLWCWGNTDALAFEDPDEPTFFARMSTEQRDARGIRRFKPSGASTLPVSPIKLPDACNVKDFSLVSQQLCVQCERGCSKCWGRSQATSSATKAAPPDECLTY